MQYTSDIIVEMRYVWDKNKTELYQKKRTNRMFVWRMKARNLNTKTSIVQTIRQKKDKRKINNRLFFGEQQRVC